MAVALGVDALSVSLVIGVKRFSFLSIIRISGITGLFHVFMPLFGLYLGNFFKELAKIIFTESHQNIEAVFDFIGAGILMLLGMYMIVESFMEDDNNKVDLTQGWGLLTLTLGVSIDAFSVGIGLGMIDFRMYSVLVFGIVAALMMGSGLYLGSKVGKFINKDIQIWGGLVLIYLGLRFSGLIF